MCGLTGFYALNTTRSKTELHVIAQRMTQSLTHRGPDSEGLWQDPDIPLVLGHRRLSILDLSSDGAQPIESESGRYIIAYNGEIYNHLTLRAQLETTGQSFKDKSFKGRSDTETLLATIEHWGLNQALQKINGMFAFALWDRKTHHLHFARDRLGKKPLYIGHNTNQSDQKHLIFGSELKALRAHPNFKPEISHEALALYMRYGFIPAPHSIYKNIWQLPPGHRLTLDLNTETAQENLSQQMKPYWSATAQHKIINASTNKKTEKQITNEFEEHLTNAVQERMVSDVPLGALLSGGIDSSTIVALMQSLSDTPVKTYTIGFHESAFNEANHARDIATHLGTDHHEHYCTAQDALDIIPTLPDIYDEPFADQSAIPTTLISKYARQSVTVALSGDGGDELLGGYTRHTTGPALLNKIRYAPYTLRKILSKAITMLPPEQWQTLQKNKPHFGHHMHKAAAILPLKTEEDLYDRLIATGETPLTLSDTETTLQSINALPEAENLTFAEKIRLWDILTYLPNDILTKTDRASMATSLELRAPLLDHALFEYVWSLPENMKIRGKQGKYLLRQTLARHIPPELFNRPKQGFNIPLGTWLRTDLKDWAEDLLDEKSLEAQGLLDTRTIRHNWQEHQKGRGNHTDMLWTVLMFQAWYRKWM